MSGEESLLTPANHDRDVLGMRHVYPVVSRRAGGVSIGVNLNPNNACNWRCVYCQVPNLTRGVAPEVDMPLLERELDAMLEALVRGDFMVRRVPEGCRVIRDVAISGNGEPTTCRQFDDVVEAIERALDRFSLLDRVDIVLITNGSCVHRPEVERGLRRMARHRGQVWLKVDAATREAAKRINGVAVDPERQMRQARRAAALCPTWIQTCMFRMDGRPPAEEDIQAWLEFLARLKGQAPGFRGVLLYGLARPSMQPEAGRLSPLGESEMHALAARAEALGIPARVSA